ncbi:MULTISPECIES: hypothetical protein [Streptomyces]|uniref:Uncharacterized protein n=2 Tax=Streptomyces TaxID=1883 RepID=A0ABV9J5F0_9ACTN
MPPRPQVPPVVTAEQWAAGFQQTHHREPTMSEYQAAVHAGLIAPERRPRDPSMQLMADGAKQVVNGAQDFFNTKVVPAVENSGAKEFLGSRVAPAALGAARSMRQSTSRSGLKLRGLATFILPAAAFLAIISLFMPAASAVDFSVNYFMGPVSGTRYTSVGAGVVLLALLSVVKPATAVLILLSPRQTPAIPPMPPARPPQS